jgi:hypothetical protein
MPTPLTAARVNSATTKAAASRTAAEATEAVGKGGRGVAPEAATGLAGRRSAFTLMVAGTDLDYWVFFEYRFFELCSRNFITAFLYVCSPVNFS